MKTVQNILIILFFIASGRLSGQVGHLITVRGDTLIGRITFSNAESKIERLWFQSGTNKRRLFVATQLKSVMIDSIDYKIVNYNGYRFTEVQKEGYLSILKFRLPDSFAFTETLLHKRDGTIIEIPLMGFRKPIGSFLSDCKEVSAKVRLKELGPKDLHQIVDEFNLCIDGGIEKDTGLSDISPVEAVAEEPISRIDRSSELDRLLKQLKTRFKYSNLKSKDFTTILRDIQLKIDQSVEVPEYLINALKSTTKGNADLLEIIDKIERSLK